MLPRYSYYCGAKKIEGFFSLRVALKKGKRGEKTRWAKKHRTGAKKHAEDKKNQMKRNLVYLLPDR